MRNTDLPRLTYAMQFAAILSHSEAQACIRDYRIGLTFSGEAVNHFGGPHAVITKAIKLRHIARDTRRLPDVR